MRTKLGMSIIAVLAAVAAFGLAPDAGARQAEGPGTGNTFSVVKEVVGPVPAGTVFEVTVQCVLDAPAAPDAELVPVTVFQFDEDGNPIGPNSVDVGFFETCTAEETDDGGAASVSYACQTAVPVANAPSEGNGQISCVNDQSVHYGDVSGANGTITVTNTFEEEPPPPPPPPPDVEPDDVVPDVVNATPSFTG